MTLQSSNKHWAQERIQLHLINFCLVYPMYYYYFFKFYQVSTLKKIVAPIWLKSILQIGINHQNFTINWLMINSSHSRSSWHHYSWHSKYLKKIIIEREKVTTMIGSVTGSTQSVLFLLAAPPCVLLSHFSVTQLYITNPQM